MSGRELSTASEKLEPGAALAAAREELGITQREVSDALNLPIATIEAIENNDQTHLPAQVFTRGYVRAYAKLLEMDAEPLVAAMGDEPLVEDAPRQGSADGSSTAAIILQRLDIAQLMQPKYLGAAAASVVVLLLLVWVFTGDEADAPAEAVQAQAAPQVSAQESPVEVEANAQPDPTPAAVTEVVDQPLPEADDVTGAPPETREEVVVAEAQQVADQSPAVAEEPAAPSEANVVNTAAAADPARRLTPDGEDRLSLEFTEECWVEIKDTEGRLLFGNLGRAGQRLEFVGAAPFRLLLGYAPGVLLSFNSEPVALTPHTRNNVASLVLGQ